MLGTDVQRSWTYTICDSNQRSLLFSNYVSLVLGLLDCIWCHAFIVVVANSMWLLLTWDSIIWNWSNGWKSLGLTETNRAFTWLWELSKGMPSTREDEQTTTINLPNSTRIKWCRARILQRNGQILNSEKAKKCKILQKIRWKPKCKSYLRHQARIIRI